MKKLLLVLALIAGCVGSSIAQEYKVTGSDHNGMVRNAGTQIRFADDSHGYYAVRSDNALCTASMTACIPADKVAAMVEAYAQQAVTFATPQTVTTTAVHVGYVGISLDNNTILAQIENSANAVVNTKTYDTTTAPTGATLLHQLNIGNFSGATSMINAVYNRLIADGVIAAGSVTGTPQ